MIQEKGSTASVSQTVDLRLCAFNQLGIQISDEMKQEITGLRRLVWSARDCTRHQALQETKAQQTAQLDDKLEVSLEFLSKANSKVFRQQVLDIANNPAGFLLDSTTFWGSRAPNQPVSSPPLTLFRPCWPSSEPWAGLSLHCLPDVRKRT